MNSAQPAHNICPLVSQIAERYGVSPDSIWR